MDKNKHLFMMRRLLRAFFSDPVIASTLRFKGGTAAMLFHGLPRFSTDLDFNIVDKGKQSLVYERLQRIAENNGKIIDASNKHFGPIVVLSYGPGERNLKIEATSRLFDNHYEMKNLGSDYIPTLVPSDMLSHKLCAFIERKAPRDLFDIWYFMSRGWVINADIILERTGKDVASFLGECLLQVSAVRIRDVMQEIGELLDEPTKKFVRKDIVSATMSALEDYIACPLLAQQDRVPHTTCLLQDDNLLATLLQRHVDPSTIDTDTLRKYHSGESVTLIDKFGNKQKFIKDYLFGSIENRSAKMLSSYGMPQSAIDMLLATGNVHYKGKLYYRRREDWDKDAISMREVEADFVIINGELMVQNSKGDVVGSAESLLISDNNHVINLVTESFKSGKTRKNSYDQKSQSEETGQSNLKKSK